MAREARGWRKFGENAPQERAAGSYTRTMESSNALENVLTTVAVPLITADEATLYVVSSSPTRVHLHLGGRYAGCPGNTFVEKSLLRPLVLEVYPNALVVVTSGAPIPAGAQRLEPAKGAASS